MSGRRSGIISKIPRSPPNTATNSTRLASKSKPKMRIAGMVTAAPKASDSPAEPAVWAILCSRIVASRPPSLAHNRNSVTEMTATGMDALTVRPTLRAK